MAEPSEIALAHFEKGYSCSQAVLTAFAPALEISPEIALKIAAPFGAGMGRMGEVCGAVSGALMVIGLRSFDDRGDIQTARDETYQQVSHFAAQFKARHGTLICRELIGVDLNDPLKLQQARDEKLFERLCPGFVGTAIELLAKGS